MAGWRWQAARRDELAQWEAFHEPAWDIGWGGLPPGYTPAQAPLEPLGSDAPWFYPVPPLERVARAPVAAVHSAAWWGVRIAAAMRNDASRAYHRAYKREWLTRGPRYRQRAVPAPGSPVWGEPGPVRWGWTRDGLLVVRYDGGVLYGDLILWLWLYHAENPALWALFVEAAEGAAEWGPLLAGTGRA